MNAEILKSKTFWAALAGIVTAVGSAITGSMSWVQAGTLILTALMGMFLKDGQISATKAQG